MIYETLQSLLLPMGLNPERPGVFYAVAQQSFADDVAADRPAAKIPPTERRS